MLINCCHDNIFTSPSHISHSCNVAEKYIKRSSTNSLIYATYYPPSKETTIIPLKKPLLTIKHFQIHLFFILIFTKIKKFFQPLKNKRWSKFFFEIKKNRKISSQFWKIVWFLKFLWPVKKQLSKIFLKMEALWKLLKCRKKRIVWKFLWP